MNNKKEKESKYNLLLKKYLHVSGNTSTSDLMLDVHNFLSENGLVISNVIAVGTETVLYNTYSPTIHHVNSGLIFRLVVEKGEEVWVNTSKLELGTDTVEFTGLGKKLEKVEYYQSAFAFTSLFMGYMEALSQLAATKLLKEHGHKSYWVKDIVKDS